MNDARQARLAENESIFRVVNERLADGHAEFALEGEQDFFCECANIGCVERLRLTLTEYARVRSNPRRFAIAPGHDEPAIEDVLECHDRYAVVEKVGPGGDIAERSAPPARDGRG